MTEKEKMLAGKLYDPGDEEIMAEQKKLLVAKTEMLQSQKQIESLYADAITAMKRYRGELEVDDPILQ